MKGKKFNCPHCNIVISLKVKSKPAEDAIESDEKPILLKEESGEIPTSGTTVAKTKRTPPPVPKKKTVYDEVEEIEEVFDEVQLVDDNESVLDEVELVVEEDDFRMSAGYSSRFQEPAYFPNQRSVPRQENSVEKTIIVTILVAFCVLFVGFAIWQISGIFRKDNRENDTRLAKNAANENEPFDEIDGNAFQENNRVAAKNPKDENRTDTFDEIQNAFDKVQRKFNRDRSRQRSFASNESNRRRNRFRQRSNGNREDSFEQYQRENQKEEKKREQEEVQREKDVERVFKEYQSAVALHEGERVVELLSEETLAAFKKFRKHALNSNKETIKGLSLIDQLMSLAIRVRYVNRRLEKIPFKSYCAQYFAEVPVEILNHGFVGVKLGKLFVFDDHASAHDNKSKLSKYVPIVYFKLEKDGWKIDLFHEKDGLDSTLKLKISSIRLQTRSRLTTEGFIVGFAKANVRTKNKNRRRVRSIWRPLKS